MFALEGIQQLVTEAARVQAAGRLLREWEDGTAAKDWRAWASEVAALLHAIAPAPEGLAPPRVPATVRALRPRR